MKPGKNVLYKNQGSILINVRNSKINWRLFLRNATKSNLIRFPSSTKICAETAI